MVTFHPVSEKKPVNKACPTVWVVLILDGQIFIVRKMQFYKQTKQIYKTAVCMFLRGIDNHGISQRQQDDPDNHAAPRISRSSTCIASHRIVSHRICAASNSQVLSVRLKRHTRAGAYSTSRIFGRAEIRHHDI